LADLLSVKDARERLLSHFQPVKPTRVPLEVCLGRVLSEDITSDIDIPPFPNSEMDGFAVRAADIYVARADVPVILRVIGDIPAGAVPDLSIQYGQAARIMTGAHIPEGADAVVPVESTDISDRSSDSPLPGEVKIYQSFPQGKYVRRRGQDIHTGQVVLQKGRRIRAQDAGLLAMLGIAHAPVYSVPRLALFSTGDELVEPDKPLEPGKIRDANTYALGALASKYGSHSISLGIVPDNYAAVQERLDRAVAQKADLIISSAGVSVGAHDYVRAVVEKAGRLEFWRVDMRPGKPIAFGYYRDVPVIGLPGNPVSAFVGFEVFVAPILARLAGLNELERRIVSVTLEEPIESDGRESYLRAIVTANNGQWTARLTGHQGSGNLYSLVQANALLIIPSGVKSLPANSVVNAWLLTYE
jgi:molybdopterin molybdotransferase